jgi:protein-S-isoprenylcysteine O-methyltransferase Ste14
MKIRLRELANVAGVIVALVFWTWSVRQPFGMFGDGVLVLGGSVGLVPVAWLGRLALDARPTVERAAWVTTWVHPPMAILAGMAIIRATIAGSTWAGGSLPLPPELGMAVALVGSGLAALSVLNLALQGLGAPWAIALSRRVAEHGVYAWTRNPMVLGGLVGLAGLGMWLQSVGFLVWALGVLAPCFVFFLKHFEERELEIRLGAPYVEYRRRTPMLWPRRPRG